MATHTVSNAGELRSAINSADRGDTILLENANYGDVYLDRASNVTLRATGDGADFGGLVLRNANNVTLDGIDFEGRVDGGGYGTDTALQIRSSSNVTVRNSEITDFAKGIQVWNASGLTIQSNTLDNISYDGMVLGHVRNTLIDRNDVTMHGRENVLHKDAIQIYNQGPRPPASDVTISNNTLTAVDGNIHGIFMGNYDAKVTGSAREAYSNISITGNVVDIQQKLGIAIGRVDGLDITGNALLRNSDGAGAVRAGNTPRILVDRDSNDVQITNNTVVQEPSAVVVPGFSPTSTPGGWSMSGNSLVSVSTGTASYEAGLNTGAGGSGGGGTGGGGTGGGGGGTGGGTDLGNGVADTFRFSGTRIDGDTTRRLNDVDFSEGDVIKLGRYDVGTFEDMVGGNPVQNNVSGSYVRIDSLADIAELDQYSSAVSASVSGNDLTVTITQDRGTLDLVLAGLGNAYQDEFLV